MNKTEKQWSLDLEDYFGCNCDDTAGARIGSSCCMRAERVKSSRNNPRTEILHWSITSYPITAEKKKKRHVKGEGGRVKVERTASLSWHSRSTPKKHPRGSPFSLEQPQWWQSLDNVRFVDCQSLILITFLRFEPFFDPIPRTSALHCSPNYLCSRSAFYEPTSSLPLS